MPSVKRRASKILNEYGAAQSELIGKAVVLTDGKAGKVENVWLDELHGLRISIEGHDGRWPVCTPRSNNMTPHIPEEFSTRLIDWSPFVIMGSTRPRNASGIGCPRRRDDRIEMLFAAVHESLVGTSRHSALKGLSVALVAQRTS